MACIVSAGVQYDIWLKWALPIFTGWLAIGSAAIMIAVSIGLS